MATTAHFIAVIFIQNQFQESTVIKRSICSDLSKLSCLDPMRQHVFVIGWDYIKCQESYKFCSLMNNYCSLHESKSLSTGDQRQLPSLTLCPAAPSTGRGDGECGQRHLPVSRGALGGSYWLNCSFHFLPPCVPRRIPPPPPKKQRLSGIQEVCQKRY